MTANPVSYRTSRNDTISPHYGSATTFSNVVRVPNSSNKAGQYKNGFLSDPRCRCYLDFLADALAFEVAVPGVFRSLEVSFPGILDSGVLS